MVAERNGKQMVACGIGHIEFLPLSVQVLGYAELFEAVAGKAPSPEASQLQVAAPERLEPVADEALSLQVFQRLSGTAVVLHPGHGVETGVSLCLQLTSI